ncbi:autotransporter assembly complex protein TamA [Methylomarinum vadi]|uniref:autotransporter assembly complex protein TamA n=1 Tax=Methylomarinum vadi TaxID=438855 RepID=UPI0004DFAA66|nr:autotransporter assembly complex family protein [Methylomarinum vadi]
MLQWVAATLIALLLSPAIARAEEPDIAIRGLNDEQQGNVRAFLSLLQEKCQSPAWRIEKLFAKSDSEIKKALKALGYYRPEISKQLHFGEACWQAEFDIKAGEPVKVAKINVTIRGEAEQDTIFQRYLQNLPLQRGDTLNHGRYEKIKQDLESLALEHGYLRHKFIKKSLRVNTDTSQADIELIFDSGPRFQFGDIKINQDILDPVFVHRYLSIASDDYYSSKQLAKTYNALVDSLYFRNVEIKPQMDLAEDNRVPVAIDLTPAKRHAYSVGVGFATDIGPLGSLGYQNRRINRRGHHFSLDLAASPVLSSAEGQYMIPYKHYRNDYVSLGAGYKLEQPNSFESEEAKLSLQQQHVYENGWRQNLFLDLSYETFTIGDVTQSTTLLVPGGRWQFTRSNNALRPTQGYHVNFSFAAAPETFISDANFVQATAYGKLINSLPWSARLITRASLGATLTDNFDRLPTSYRFYAGGTETIRGYQYKELGPTNAQGDVIGGKMLTVASFEYEQFLSESWGIAAFVDAGNAYNIEDITIKTGVGLGLRWVSPIGPIRLDFAVPLNESDSSFQFHFAAGAQL